MAEDIKHDFRKAELSPRHQVLCEFAEKVTRTPAETCRQDLDRLRAHGLSDRDILDAVEVVAYFNYVNRVADALGIDPEPEMQQTFENRQ